MPVISGIETTGVIPAAIVVGLIVVALIWWYRHNKGCRIELPRRCNIESAEASQLIRALRSMLNRRNEKILLDVGGVDYFPYETYMTICAQAQKASDRGKTIALYSSGPLSQSVRHTLQVSNNAAKTLHFHLTGERTRFTKESTITPHVIQMITRELEKIGIRNYYDLNTLVTEIIGNALEHGIKDRNINWWMYYKLENEMLKLVFVDMGMGIISSYRKALIGLFYPDRRLIRKAIEGKIGSSTKQPNRGNGFLQMNQMIKNKYISDFTLITNCVTLRYKDEYTVERHTNFVGTYYSMTINFDNYTKWQTSLTSQKTMVQP